LKGKTPAQASGVDVEDSWLKLIKSSILSKTESEAKIFKMIEEAEYGVEEKSKAEELEVIMD